jgi:hypothetical protein
MLQLVGITVDSTRTPRMKLTHLSIAKQTYGMQPPSFLAILESRATNIIHVDECRHKKANIQLLLHKQKHQPMENSNNQLELLLKETIQIAAYSTKILTTKLHLIF